MLRTLVRAYLLFVPLVVCPSLVTPWPFVFEGLEGCLCPVRYLVIYLEYGNQDQGVLPIWTIPSYGVVGAFPSTKRRHTKSWWRTRDNYFIPRLLALP